MAAHASLDTSKSPDAGQGGLKPNFDHPIFSLRVSELGGDLC
jgi:hypothetical protein